MTTLLQPPPERDLPAERRSAIRAAVLRSTRPRRRLANRTGLGFRWAVATAVVGVLVIAALVVPRLSGRPLIAQPAQPPSAAPSAIGPASSSPAGPLPSAVPTTPGAVPSAASSVDQGPLSATARAARISSCLKSLDRTATVADVHFARQIAGAGSVVLFSATDGLAFLCSDTESSLYAGSGSKTRALGVPSADRPVIRIMSPGYGGSGRQRSTVRTAAAYRVSDQVERIELRLVVDGRAGPWSSAAVAGGYAYGTASVVTAGSAGPDFPDVQVQDRAYDRAGRELTIDRTPR